MARPWRVPALGVVTSVWAGLLLAWAYLAYAHTPTLVSLGGDSAIYALTARHFGQLVAGSPDPVAALAAANSVYPPLHPLLLALVGAGRTDSWLAGNLLVTAELWLALVVFHLWLLRRGFAWGVALAATLALGLAPGVWQQTVMLQSENLFLLTTLAALTWFEGPAPGTRRLVMTPRGAAVATAWSARAGPWPALACIALAMLTRTAGVALWAGAVAAWAWGRMAPGRAWRAPLASQPLVRVLAGLALAAAPLLLWNVLHRPEDPYTASLVRTYGHDGGWLATLAAQMRLEIQALVRAWPQLFGLPPRLGFLAWAVAGLGLAGLLGRAARGRVDGWYALAYLAMIIIWPFPAEAARFLLVILPLAWAAALELPVAVVGWARQRQATDRPVSGAGPAPWLAGLLAGGLLVALAPGAALAWQQWFAARPPGGSPAVPEDWRHRPAWFSTAPLPTRLEYAATEDAYRALHAELARLTPAGACVLSPKAPLSMVFGHRRAFGLPRPELDDTAFQAALQRRGCRYLLAMAAATPTYPELYPLTRLTDIERIQPLPPGPRALALLVTLRPPKPSPP